MLRTARLQVHKELPPSPIRLFCSGNHRHSSMISNGHREFFRIHGSLEDEGRQKKKATLRAGMSSKTTSILPSLRRSSGMSLSESARDSRERGVAEMTK